jgi:hypothetical protein
MINYEDTFGSMASKHKILVSWLDKTGLFSWVVTETSETHFSPSLQIHKQNRYGTEHSKVCIMVILMLSNVFYRKQLFLCKNS